MLLWIALIISFSSLSFVLVRAEKRERVLLNRIELLETAFTLTEREFSELKKDVNVLLATETLSSTVEESLQKIEHAIGDINTGESLTDQLEFLVGREAELERDKLDIVDLEGEVLQILHNLSLSLSIRDRRR